jgi:hypothetical protein
MSELKPEMTRKLTMTSANQDQKLPDRGDNLIEAVKAGKEALKPKDADEINEVPEAHGMPEVPGADATSNASAKPTR